MRRSKVRVLFVVVQHYIFLAFMKRPKCLSSRTIYKET